MAKVLHNNLSDNAFKGLFHSFLMHPVRFEGKHEIQIKVDVNALSAADFNHKCEIPHLAFAASRIKYFRGSIKL